jgi:3-dehydroquinate dehydratase-1
MMMKMKTLAALTLLVSPLFTVQMVQAQENVQKRLNFRHWHNYLLKQLYPLLQKLKSKRSLKQK